MLERFSERARKVMAMANQEAQRLGHQYIGTEHILLALVREGDGVGANVIKSLGIELGKVRLEVEKIIKSGPNMPTSEKSPQTPRAKNVIAFAIQEARDLNHGYVGTEHLLLGLLKEEGGVAYTALSIVGMTLDQARKSVIELRAMGCVDSPPQKHDPQIAALIALRQLLPGNRPGDTQADDGGYFEVKAVDSGATIVYWIATQIDTTWEDLATSASRQAAMAMRSVADRLEKSAVELRESAARLKE